MKLTLPALSFLICGNRQCAKLWIPAENFNKHTDTAPEDTPNVDDATNKQVYLLSAGQQVRFKIGFNDKLKRHLDEYPVFKVCALVANYYAIGISAI